MTSPLKVAGRLDVKALDAAVAVVLRLHSALTATFHIDTATMETYATLHPEASVACEVEVVGDWREDALQVQCRVV